MRVTMLRAALWQRRSLRHAMVCARVWASGPAAATVAPAEGVVPPRAGLSRKANSMNNNNKTSAASSPPKFSKNTSDAAAYAALGRDEVPSYSGLQHFGYRVLHSRRLWLPVVLGVGYYAAAAPLLASGGAFLGASATMQKGLYWTLAALVQRYSVRGAMNPLRKDLRGRVCVVTGGTSGIGLHTALQLLNMGATVVIADRPGKEADTLAFLQANYRPTTPTTTTAAAATKEENTASDAVDRRVVFVPMDYMDQREVMVAAARIKGLFDDRLDLLVNCAAVWTDVPRVTRQQWDEHIGVNFLGPFHLTEALLPSLRRARSGRGRVVYVTCAVHGGVRTADVVHKCMMPQQTPTIGGGGGGKARTAVELTLPTARGYSASKLGNIYHAQSLAARRYEGIALSSLKAASHEAGSDGGAEHAVLHPVDVCCVDPGFCATSLMAGEEPPLLGNGWFGRTLRSLWLKTPYEGSQSVVYGCLVEPLEQGGYYAECRYMPSGLSKRAQDTHAREEVIRWAMAKTIAKFYNTTGK